MMTQRFREDFLEVLRMIGGGESFALARFADGEASVLKNVTVGNKDGWLYRKDRNLVFRSDLRKSLLCTDDNYLYGLSCTCCDVDNHGFLVDAVRTRKENLTFSNIWVNANFALFHERFLPALRKSGRPVVLCTNEKARLGDLEREIPLKDFLPIPGNCVKYWERRKEEILGLLDLKASLNRDTIFLFAAGPLSEILIHAMWTVNPRNVYLDIGSTLDPVLFRRDSRGYHKPGHAFADRVCVW